MDQQWCSRRSPVFSFKGMCASSQPLATKAGTQILEKGGNAADAAIAMASCLAVTEPCSTGLGGDCFALYFDAKTKQVTAMNGSGRSPQLLSKEKMMKAVQYNSEREIMIDNRNVILLLLW
jgi:gamma-glutamyltranspeptidase/glutathione hydrolase